MFFDKFFKEQCECNEGRANTDIEEIEISEINYILPQNEYLSSDIISLADNIRKIGLLFPINLFRNNKGCYLLSGARRISAYKLLGRKSIPSIICTDAAKADNIFVAENHFAEHGDVLRSAAVAGYLFNTRKMTVSEIAYIMEVSKKYADCLLNLIRLSPEECRKLRIIQACDRKIMEISEISNEVLRNDVINRLYQERKSADITIKQMRAERSKPRFCAPSLLDNSFQNLADKIKNIGKNVTMQKSESQTDIIYTVSVSK